MKLNQGLTTFAFLAMMGIGCTSPTATQVEFDTEGVAVESDSALRERVGERYLITFRNFRQSKATLRGAGAHVAMTFPRKAMVAAYVPAAALQVSAIILI